MSQKWFNNIDLQQNELQNGVIQNLAGDPSNGKAGQIYYNTTDKGYRYHNGTTWVSITAEAIKSIVAGDGLTSSGTDTVTISLGTPSTSGAESGTTYGSNGVTETSHTHQVRISAATTDIPGVVELATDAEATAGTDTTKAINAKQLNDAKKSAIESAKVTIQTSNGITGGSATPSNSFTLSGVDATTEAKGVVQLAADNDTTSTNKAVTPKQLEAARKGAEVTVTAGNGLTGGGTGNSLSIAMGTPSAVNQSSGNSVTATSHTHKLEFAAVNSPTTEGEEISFIDTVSQGVNGGISATKKTVRSASKSQTGVVQLATQEEVNGGTNDTNAVTPETLRKGKASGVASLDANGKVIASQLPDYLLGQVMYGGNASTVATTTTVSPSDSLKAKKNITATSISIENSATSTKDNTYGYKDLEGVYFICQASGTFAGNSFEKGDWIISTGAKWEKIDNTDAVKSVNGKIGDVNITRVDEAGTADKVAHHLFIESNGNADNTKRYDGQSSIALNFSSDYFRSVPCHGIDSVTGEKPSGISVEPRPTGVTAGTYNRVTVDDRGRVIAGESASEQFQKFVYTFRGDGTTTSFDITHPLGTDVVVQVYLMRQTVGSDTLDELVMVDTYTMYGKVKLVFAMPPTATQSFKVVIIGTKTNLGTLDETDWSTIRSVIMSGNVANYWSVGDIKTITSKSGKEYSIRLIDIQNGRYDYSDGSGSSKAVFEFANCYDLRGTSKWKMNSSYTNVGGWAQSLIKTSAIPAILADLPDDMVSVMSEVKVLSGIGGGTGSGTSSSDNKLFLAAESELVSSPSISIGTVESPLGAFDYYKTHTDALSKIKAVVGTGNEIAWWLRSPRRVNSTAFCYITERGVLSYYNADSADGVSPIFAI